MPHGCASSFALRPSPFAFSSRPSPFLRLQPAHGSGTSARLMGRQWLQAKREVAGLKKGQMVGKIVKEIMVAAKLGGPDPDGNPRLFAAIEKARRQGVTRDVIERATKKGAGIGDEKLVMDHIVF